MKEKYFTIQLTIKSTRGISFDKAMLGILQMEISANEKGNPRFHFTEIIERKGDKDE